MVCPQNKPIKTWGTYKDESMITYLDIAKGLLGRFKVFRITQIPQDENEKADALTKLASTTTNIWPKIVPVTHLSRPSINKQEELLVGEIKSRENNWMTPIRDHIERGIFPKDPIEARWVRYRATWYTIIGGELYRNGFSKILQRCIGSVEASKILKSFHSRVCRNHTQGKSLAHKTLIKGFYWPAQFANSQKVVESCETCQEIANDYRQPLERQRSLTSPWPLSMLGLDLIKPMPTRTRVDQNMLS